MNRFERLLLLPCGFLLALPGALYRTSGQVENWRLIMACLVYAALVSAAAYVLYVSQHLQLYRQLRPALSAGVALAMCVIFPLATDTIRNTPLAGAALLLSALAAGTVAQAAPVRMVVAPAAIALACAADAAALTLPLGMAFFAGMARRDRGLALWVLIAGAAGVTASWWAGAPVFSTERMTGLAHSVGRDAVMMLAPLILGSAAWFYAAFRRTESEDPALEKFLSAWSLVGLIALVAGLLGAPLNPQLALLPFWCWVSRGLLDLSQHLTARGFNRVVPVCSLLLLLSLAAAPGFQWISDALMVAFVLLPAVAAAR